jgi:hypothetical protein
MQLIAAARRAPEKSPIFSTFTATTRVFQRLPGNIDQQG